MWVTLGIWLAVTLLLAIFAPSAKDYESSSIESLPADAKSVIAQNKVDQYFKNNEGIPAILVFQSQDSKVELGLLEPFYEEIGKVEGIKEIVPLTKMPPQAAAGFFSEDQSTLTLPLTFDPSLESAEMREVQEQIEEIVKTSTDLKLNITGPAGIAVDSLNLFSRADIVLLLSTVGLILVLLIVIYRSPLLALIPLLAAAFVYKVVNQVLETKSVIARKNDFIFSPPGNPIFSL